jgi:hypothetical protein
MTTNTTKSRKRVILRGCQRCHGDLMREPNEFVCMQCGRSAPLPKSERTETSWGAVRLPVAATEPATVRRTAA